MIYVIINCQCGMSHKVLAGTTKRLLCSCGTIHETDGLPLMEHNEVNPWIPLHEYGPKHADNWVDSSARRWFLEWSKTIPADGCACESHWAELMQEMPPDYSSAKAFFEWSWKSHDIVSERHSKRPRISLQEAYALYWREL